jgi:hypothetical protein
MYKIYLILNLCAMIGSTYDTTIISRICNYTARLAFCMYEIRDTTSDTFIVGSLMFWRVVNGMDNFRIHFWGYDKHFLKYIEYGCGCGYWSSVYLTDMILIISNGYGLFDIFLRIIWDHQIGLSDKISWTTNTQASEHFTSTPCVVLLTYYYVYCLRCGVMQTQTDLLHI